MSVQYQAIAWNRQKRIYDIILLAAVLAYPAVFVGIGSLVHSQATIETLLIRACGTAALLLLHVVSLDRPVVPLKPAILATSI